MEYDEGQIRNKVKVSLIRNKKKESSSKKKNANASKSNIKG